MFLLLLILILTLLLPNQAYAEESQARNFPILKSITEDGMEFWHKRNVYPPKPIFYLQEEMGEYAALTVRGKPNIWIRTFFYKQADPSSPAGEEQLFILVLHEMGHTAGLEHTDTGLMAPAIPATSFEARQWRRKWDKQYKILYAKGHIRNG